MAAGFPRSSSLNTCRSCGLRIEGASAAVMEWSSDGLAHRRYVPFLEDLRTRPDAVVHLECFSREQGLANLLALIAEHDRAQRRGFWEMHSRLEVLERQLKPQSATMSPGSAAESSLRAVPDLDEELDDDSAE
jgi:hypothetical protein